MFDGVETKYETLILNVSQQDSSNSTATTVSAAESWTISITNGDATIKNVSLTNRVIQFNASAKRFAAYTGTQMKVQIYKLA